jgi:hypothetical protein
MARASDPGAAASGFAVEVREDVLDDNRIFDAGDDLDVTAAARGSLHAHRLTFLSRD